MARELPCFCGLSEVVEGVKGEAASCEAQTRNVYRGEISAYHVVSGCPARELSGNRPPTTDGQMNQVRKCVAGMGIRLSGQPSQREKANTGEAVNSGATQK